MLLVVVLMLMLLMVVVVMVVVASSWWWLGAPFFGFLVVSGLVWFGGFIFCSLFVPSFDAGAHLDGSSSRFVL